MGNNNRWSREGGVIDEIVVENTFRNPEGNPLLFDALLLDKVCAEGGIKLLLNTAVFSAEKGADGGIRSVQAFNSQNSTLYQISAPLFCDASGDGVLGYLSGAHFRMGAEASEEFGEQLAPVKPHENCLGHSLLFYTKETGEPVRYTPPDFALKDIRKIPRYNRIAARDHGCYLWWLEYGGCMDVVHDTEEIKWELWRIAYGIWDYLKNSGRFAETANMTLEWIGVVPGKRESRRFEGSHILNQRDVVDQHRFDDAVSYGGWAVDLHPADGVYSDKPACLQYHSRGVYQIPYRCLYSRNIENLLLAGRLISASHVAFGSTRVMMTCAHTAQAVGMAAALCKERGALPADLTDPAGMRVLQRRLQRAGQFIPHLPYEDPEDLASRAGLEVSSELHLEKLRPSETTAPLDCSRALLFPARKGRLPAITFHLISAQSTELVCQLRVACREGNFTPDRVLEEIKVTVAAGENSTARVEFTTALDRDQYVFVCMMPCAGAALRLSDQLVTGMLALVHAVNGRVAEGAVQKPAEGSGFDTFEFWLPERRPAGKLPAVEFSPPLKAFDKAQLRTGYMRPFIQSNAWVAAVEDPAPQLTLKWEASQLIREVVLFFDADYDHAMEAVQYGHPEREMPFCVKHFQLLDAADTLLHEEYNNHQGRVAVRFAAPVRSDKLVLRILKTHGSPAAVFGIVVL